MSVVIGLYSPYPQMGKSTFASALLEGHPRAHTDLKFAEPGREMATAVAGYFLPGGGDEVQEWLEDERKDTCLIPKLGVTLRVLLQQFLQAGRERVNPDIWVLLAHERLQWMRRHYSLVVADDLRYENEYAMLKAEGAHLIRIDRKDAPPTTPHISNARLDDLPFDFHITNDGSPEDLELKAKLVLRELGVLQ